MSCERFCAVIRSSSGVELLRDDTVKCIISTYCAKDAVHDRRPTIIRASVAMKLIQRMLYSPSRIMTAR